MYTVVGLIKENGKITGFRVVDHNTLEYMDISEANARSMIRKITNIKIHNGEIRGKSGVLDRYGEVGDTNTTYTVLYVLLKGDKKIGYEVANNNGNIKRFSIDKVMELHSKGKITNAKINGAGLSPVKGTFEMKEIQPKKKV